MAASISQPTPQRLDVPSCTGKRTRSNSTSSSTSSVTSSNGASSIFSNSHSGSLADNLSSYSSPSSVHTSPSTAGSISDDERPCKSLRTTSSSNRSVSSIAAEEDVVATLTNLEQKCSLSASSSIEQSSSSKDVTPSPPVSGATVGKTLFVDCLVDATVHVLTMIWNAPVHKSIAFLENVNSVSASKSDHEARSDCTCPVGSPVPGGIPLDLFIRETLRRSRTSCSTLQAALLYCKRVGFEVVRKRAETEGIILSDEHQQFLKGNERDYTSLTRSIDAATEATLPAGVSADPILCSRRTFLASIMISSKFLQDRTFSNRAWSKISGLNVRELGIVERRMLSAIEFDLSVNETEWKNWTQFLKGEYKKISMSSCSCKSTSTSGDLVQSVANVLATMKENTVLISANSPKGQVPIRKSLERTSSLTVETTNDMEVPNTSCVSSGSSTPLQDLRMSSSSTPTKSSFVGAHKREPSMLATVVTNNMIGSVTRGESPAAHSLNATPTQSTVHEHGNVKMDMPLPFPLRKGLAVRSISALS